MTRTPPCTERDFETERWLLSTLVGEGRDRARVEWQELGMTVLPLGTHFSAVRIPGALVHAAAKGDEQSTVTMRLAEYLRGPVIHDPGFDRYYALVPTSTDQVGVVGGTQYLSSGTYLGVPRTDQVELDKETLGSYWAVPMAGPQALCRLVDVCEFVLLGHILTADEEQS
jgi:hypothetical protein